MSEVQSPRAVRRRQRGGVSVPDAIKTAALDLFVRHGFENTSVDAIVGAAGVTKGAMYHHFTSKQDLLFDIYDRLIAEQSAHLDEITGRPAPAAERLRAAAVDVILTSLSARAEATVFFRSRHLLSPENAARVGAQRRAYSHRFQQLLREGVAEGVVRGDLPVVVLEGYFFGAVHYLAEWYDDRGTIPPEQLADAYAELMLASVRPAQ